jgi:hypothetical protein
MHPSGTAHVAPGFSPADGEAEPVAERGAALKGGATQQSLVLPSVPVDQLLDDHAIEFEECKRWANSEAGQAAKMTNPAGFANVRAHTEAHLRAMSLAANANPAASNAAHSKGKRTPASMSKET